jgi:cytochrome c553
MNKITLILAAVTALLPSALNAGNCGKFFQGHAYRHQVVHHVQQQVFYFAGQATQDEAITRKAIRAELPAIVDAVRQQLQSPVQQQATGIIAAKCASCHSGESPKGGVDLTGEIGDDIFRRSMEILSGKDVPGAMKPVLAGLKEGDAAALMEAMLNKRPTGVLR